MSDTQAIAPPDRARNPARPAAARLKAFFRGGLSAPGLAVALVLFAALGAGGAWILWDQGFGGPLGREARLRAAGATLSRSAEVLLERNELTAVRGLLVDAARDAGAGRWRIVLPDNGVIADSDPRRISVTQLPASWQGSPRAEPAGGPGAAIAFPIVVPGRGKATLQISHWAEPGGGSWWPAAITAGAVFAAALCGLVLMQRRTLSGGRGVTAIRQALLEYPGGKLNADALKVNPDWGPEAKAWNALLADEQTRRKQRAREETLQSLRAGSQGGACLAAACDALSQGLILVDQACHATYINGAAAMFLRLDRDKAVGADVAEFLSEEGVLNALREACNGPIQRRTILEVERDGEAGKAVLRFIVRPARNEDAAIAMLIVEDITQQRVAAEARQSFLAQAAHELRTPLTNIRLNAEMALNELKNDPKAQARCVSLINGEAIRLEQMVGDVLSVAEVESGSLRLKRDDVRLDELLHDIQAAYGAQAEEKQIKLTFDLAPKLPVLHGDRGKIAQAMHNLVGNALKYTPKKGKVHVAASVADGQFVMEVKDTGIGIAEKDCQRVFERFYRAKSKAVSQIQGSGLGLTIAREIARLHGGDISLVSKLKEGSTFTLRLPAPEESA